MKKTASYRTFLIQALELRQVKNQAYTIGSFGRLLGLDASRMAQILTGKVGISVKRALEIADILKFSEHDKKMFILLVQAEHERNPEKKLNAQNKIAELENEVRHMDDIFHSISDWHHHAIVEMIGLNDPSHTNEVMAKKIGIPLETMNVAIERLLSLELIKKASEDESRYVTTEVNRRTGQDIPSESVKVLNEQILEKAAVEIRNQDISNRDYSVTVFQFNKDQMEKLKEKIKNFRREILKEFEMSSDKNSVYSMSIQLFELTGKDV